MLASFLNKAHIEVGCDEAGRGCLAGPVVAAAVILPKNFHSSMLNDSKQLSEKKRLELKAIILEEAIAYGIGIVDPKKIDEINILNASILGMHRAIEKLDVVPHFIAVDGNKFKPYGEIPYHCQIKGDAKYQNIAAASVLAKTYRDELMRALATEHPHYQWERNAGYPTKAHRDGIRTHGSSPHHRKSFQLLPSQLNLFDL